MKGPEIRTGIDLILNSRIESKLSNGKFLEKVFHPSELREADAKKLAGIFAVKESVFKALDLPASGWLEIEVVRSRSGRPEVRLSDLIKPRNLASIDCSISHDGDYTVGSVAVLLGGPGVNAKQFRQ